MAAKLPKESPSISRKAAPKPNVPPEVKGTCPSVGIGASAGGLGALEQFLGNVPKNSGLAFVVLQHLDPTHKTLMPELLQRVTPMQVLEVNDGTRIHADRAHIVPPNKDIATDFLGPALNIRRFTAQTARITKLIPGDVGRPITDISADLVYPELAEDADSVLRTLVAAERQIFTRDGHWFGARIMPYRTLDNVIDGVVITFMDITRSKELEAKLRKNEIAPAKRRERT